MSFHASVWLYAAGRFCVLMGQLRAMLARGHAPMPFPSTFVSVTRSPKTETEVTMTTINLRDYYPFYTSDCFIEVSEEIAAMLREADRKEAAYRLRTYRHKAYYSLDRGDGIEHEAIFFALSPHEIGLQSRKKTRYWKLFLGGRLVLSSPIPVLSLSRG